MESKDFLNKYDYYDWINIPDGTQAAVAKYRQFSLVEYNNNPMIEALPPILSPTEFVDKVTKLPLYEPSERELKGQERFQCIERLSRYFDPLQKTIDLHQTVCVLLMSGYLSRNILKPEYARCSREIYNSIQAKDGHNLENYVTVKTVPTTASGLTIIGESGLGKSTNLANILDLYPQVILHPQYSVTQIVWLKVDCPHAGSLKGLCSDIFLAVDRLLGTNHFKKFGSRGNSEDYMLAQVAQIAHTHHLGLLIIDEMQNLTNARRGRDSLLNFLVKMDNIIGIPVIRVGTNEKVCVIHGVGLVNSGVLVKEMGKSFVAAGEESCVGDGVSYGDGVLQGLWEFGKVIEGRMRENGGFRGLKCLRDEYMSWGWLDERRLEERMLECYGEAVLREVHPEMMENLGEYVLGCLLGCDVLLEVDRVVHWLVGGL